MYRIGIFFIIILILLAGQVSADTISSSNLINKSKEYDNKEIVYEGEIIGDIMARGKHAWINLSDGINAIGIWVDRAMLNDIKYTGDFGFKGDIVEVKGVFHRSCLDHGGDLDIHALSIKVVRRGYSYPNRVNNDKVRAIFILSLTLALLALLSISKSKML
jgi:hypothetical protein